MTEEQLRAWLAPSGGRGGAALFTDQSFVVAVLRDIYLEEDLVTRWLAAPRGENARESAMDLLSQGDAAGVRQAAVQEWNSAMRGARRMDPRGPVRYTTLDRHRMDYEHS